MAKRPQYVLHMPFVYEQRYCHVIISICGSLSQWIVFSTFRLVYDYSWQRLYNHAILLSEALYAFHIIKESHELYLLLEDNLNDDDLSSDEII